MPEIECIGTHEVSLHLLDGLVRDGQSELLLGNSEVEPQLSRNKNMNSRMVRTYSSRLWTPSIATDELLVGNVGPIKTEGAMSNTNLPPGAEPGL